MNDKLMNTITFIRSDIDECLVSNECDSNASCENTIGSFICQCKIGFTGDGSSCSGEYDQQDNATILSPMCVCSPTPTQILMSVRLELSFVIQMQSVIILMVATPAPVHLDSLEME